MTLSFDEEVRLYTSNAEREKYESMATLFGIIIALDYLERAYVRDAVPASEYAPKCVQLLGRYKTMWGLVSGKEWVGGDVEEFMKRYRMDNQASLHRLRVGVPATVEHATQNEAQTAKWVAETTQSFINFMDAIKLKYRAKDQLYPMLQELMTGYARFKGSKDWEGRGKMVQWLILLNGMKAADELDEDQLRQLMFDIEHAYAEFFRSLGGSKDAS